MSEATVFVRVKKLTQRGALKGFRAIVEPKLVGKTLTAFILIRAQPKAYPAMLAALKKLEDVYEIYDVTGQYYSILKARTSDTDELSKIIDEIGAVEGVAGTETIIVFRTVKEDLNIKIQNTAFVELKEAAERQVLDNKSLYLFHVVRSLLVYIVVKPV